MLTLRPENVVTTWPTLGPPPRKVRPRRKTILLITGVPAGALLLSWLMVSSRNEEVARLDQLITKGQETHAQLIGRGTRRNGRGSKYLVRSRFRVGSQWYTVDFESRQLFDTARQGQAVTVLHDPARPWIAKLATRDDVARQREELHANRWWPPAVLIPLSVAFSAIVWLSMRHDLRLARIGILRWGTVTNARTASKTATVTVFVDDQLGKVERTFSTTLAFEDYQPVGSKVAVLSDPADPSRMSLCENVMSSVVVDAADRPA
jgi:hypothetical protein